MTIWFITEINICVYASFEIPENQKSGIEHKFGSVVITSCLIGKLSEVGGNLEYRIGVRLGMGVLVFCSAPVVELGCAALLKVKFRLAEVSFGAVTSLACSEAGKRDPHYKIETSAVEVRSTITSVPLNVCSLHLS